jgi:hypothetical protein
MRVDFSQERVLFLNHPEADYGGGFLHNGLCELLGADRVYDFPIKYSYHGNTHFYNHPDGSLGETGPFFWYEKKPIAWSVPVPTAQYVRDLLTSGFFTLVVLESCRRVTRKVYEDLADAIQKSGVKVVIHDGEDYSDYSGEFIAQVQPAMVLKREVRAGAGAFGFHVEGAPVWGFPFSAVTETVAVSEAEFLARQYDVAMLFGNTHKAREFLYDTFRLAKRLPAQYLGYGGRQDDDAQGNVSPADYLRTLSNSRMGASVRGYGYDTCRFWETIGRTALLVDTLDLHIPRGYTHGESCLVFSTADHALDLACEYAAKPKELYEIYRQGVLHTNRHHTNKQRAAYLYELLR